MHSTIGPYSKHFWEISSNYLCNPAIKKKNTWQDNSYMINKNNEIRVPGECTLQYVWQTYQSESFFYLQQLTVQYTVPAQQPSQVVAPLFCSPQEGRGAPYHIGIQEVGGPRYIATYIHRTGLMGVTSLWSSAVVNGEEASAHLSWLKSPPALP